MNPLQTYFSLKYGNARDRYLALFALTPPPFSRDPSKLTEQKLLEQMASDPNVLAEYPAAQRTTLQRKAVLRPKALKFDEASTVLPNQTRGEVLQNMHQQMASSEHRGLLKDINTVRNYAPDAGDVKSYQEARERLAQLKPEQWDELQKGYQALEEVRNTAKPVSQAIGVKASPINRSVKNDALEDFNARLANAPQGTKPKDIPVPSYVENPDLIRKPKLTKGGQLKLKYAPKTNPNSAIEGRLAAIRDARNKVQDYAGQMYNVAKGNLSPTELPLTEQQRLAAEALKQAPAAGAGIVDNVQQVSQEAAKKGKRAGKKVAQVVETVAETASKGKGKGQTIKEAAVDLLNLNPGQRRVMGGIGLGAVVLGGGLLTSSLVTNHLIRKRREDELRKQEEDYYRRQAYYRGRY